MYINFEGSITANLQIYTIILPQSIHRNNEQIGLELIKLLRKSILQITFYVFKETQPLKKIKT